MKLNARPIFRPTDRTQRSAGTVGGYSPHIPVVIDAGSIIHATGHKAVPHRQGKPNRQLPAP